MTDPMNDGVAEPASLFFPLLTWVFETLEESVKAADPDMTLTEGIVLMILHKRGGKVESGAELESIYRSWNHTSRSSRALSELGFAVQSLVDGGWVSAEGDLSDLGVTGAGELDPKSVKSVRALRHIELTDRGKSGVQAMRSVITERLRLLEGKFEGRRDQYIEAIRQFALPPLTLQDTA